jgi:V/A-type H+-transporting ATPase subunit E
MDTSSALERTVNKVLTQAESDMISKIDSAYNDAVERLVSSKTRIQSDHNSVIEDAKKQAENLKRQIVGSSRLAARNRQLVIVEEAVTKAFEKARAKIDSVRGSEKYAAMMRKLLGDGINAVSTEEVIVQCNSKDKEIVKKIVSELERNSKVRIKLDEESIDTLGGLRVMSKDGSMVYDNTLDSRIERLRPIIRKDIAVMFMK